MKLIKPVVHAFLDYAVVLLLLTSPSFFAFSTTIAFFTYALGAVHLTLTATTDFPGGIFKIIPLKVHGIVELSVSFLLFIGVWIYPSISDVDRNYYLAFSILVFLTWLLTDYQDQKSH